MGVSLKKGGNVSLTKEAPGLTEVVVGLGWDPRVTDGSEFDLDASVFICRLNAANEPKLIADEYFVFYNNKQSPDGGVTHSGDNRTGDAGGDDETIRVNLDKVHADAREISFIVTIHDAVTRGQNFGQIQNAYIRLYDDATGRVVAEYDLDEMFSQETAVQFGSFFRQNGEWSFKAVGAGYRLDLGDFVGGYQ